MTIKSQSEHVCPECGTAWLPYAPGLRCPKCGRTIATDEVVQILAETLESARFNKRLYGKIALEFWVPHRLGDEYLAWAFVALDAAEKNPHESPDNVALNALVSVDLEAMAPYREHVYGYLKAAIEAYRAAVNKDPAAWQKMPEPEKPFFGRKIIE